MDRNREIYGIAYSAVVALRKESVDRNIMYLLTASGFFVALRKESVDRNRDFIYITHHLLRRSPQGERG